MKNYIKKQEVDAAVGMTRKWDAREAGREVARNTIKQLNSPPNFFLLFSTIHYRDHGGFEEFLNGVWDVLPKGTPLIGGTVVGFMVYMHKVLQLYRCLHLIWIFLLDMVRIQKGIQKKLQKNLLI